MTDEKVLGILRDQLGSVRDLSCDLSDFGVDTIDWEEIAHELEIDFEVEIDFEKLTHCKNGYDIKALVGSLVQR